MIATVNVKIESSTAILLHAFPMQPIEALEKKLPEEQAEFAAYREPETRELYFPSVNLQRALIAAAVYSKGKGRGSLQKSAAACLMLSPERMLFGTRVFAVDARPVVIPATKGRIMRFRPRLDTWRLEFTLEFDDALISAKQARQIVDDAGTRVGIGDFRPEKKGPFGRFKVIGWESNGAPRK